MSTSTHPVPGRWSAFAPTAFAACASALVLMLAGCATRTDDGLSANPPFAEGWKESSRPLYYDGPGLSAGTTAWKVPATLPRGTYQVIQRDGDRARVVDGYRFEVDAAPFKEIKLLLPMPTNNVEALDVKYLVSQAAPGTAKP